MKSLKTLNKQGRLLDTRTEKKQKLQIILQRPNTKESPKPLLSKLSKSLTQPTAQTLVTITSAVSQERASPNLL